jgi:iron complex transport system substrate-binding protein
MRTDLVNMLALFACLVAGGLAALAIVPQDPLPRMLLSRVGAEPAGWVWTTDARGVSVPIGDYRRIVSLNPVADHLLLQLVPPERLVGITAHTAENHPDGWRFGARARLGTSRDIEQVLGLHPDLVIASQFSEEAYMARLREAGVVVFDLGDTRNAQTTFANIETLGLLLGVSPRAARLGASYRRELDSLARAGALRTPLPGIYLTQVGGVWFGGTRGSSYGDLLRLSGVADLAGASGYRDWPQFSREQILSLAPPLVITREGGRAALCGDAVLSRLPACSPAGRVIEMPDAYDSDPGLGLVQAVALLQSLLADADSTEPRF